MTTATTTFLEVAKRIRLYVDTQGRAASLKVEIAEYRTFLDEFEASIDATLGSKGTTAMPGECVAASVSRLGEPHLGLRTQATARTTLGVWLTDQGYGHVESDVTPPPSTRGSAEPRWQ